MARANLHQILVVVDTQLEKVNPDKAPSIKRGHEYPLQIWYLLLTFIALVSISHFTVLLSNRLRTPTIFSPRARSSSAFRRLPAVAVHIFRTTAFRVNTSLGGYTLNFTEFFFGCAYIAVIFTWAFVNSEWLRSSFWPGR